ncbi:hypothetical protein LX36DRAFT_669006, partial [Colletotrichum falcatum]
MGGVGIGVGVESDRGDSVSPDLRAPNAKKKRKRAKKDTVYGGWGYRLDPEVGPSAATHCCRTEYRANVEQDRIDAGEDDNESQGLLYVDQIDRCPVKDETTGQRYAPKGVDLLRTRRRLDSVVASDAVQIPKPGVSMVSPPIEPYNNLWGVDEGQLNGATDSKLTSAATKGTRANDPATKPFPASFVTGQASVIFSDAPLF